MNLNKLEDSALNQQDAWHPRALSKSKGGKGSSTSAFPAQLADIA